MTRHRKFMLIATMLLLSASACEQIQQPVITPAPSSTATPLTTLEPTPVSPATSTVESLPTATAVQPIPPEDIGPFRGVTSLPNALTSDGGEMRLRTSADGSVWILTSQAALRWYGQAWETVLAGSEVLPVDVDNDGRLWALPPGEVEIAAWQPVRQLRASGGQWMAYESASGWKGTPASEVMSWWRHSSWRPLTQAGGILWLPVGGELRALHGNLWTTHTQQEMGFPALEMEDVELLNTLAARSGGAEVWVGECYYSGPGPMGGGGVRWFDGQTWQGAEAPVGQTCVSAITVDPARNVWLGAYDTVWRYDAASQEWTSFQMPEVFLADYNFAYPQQLMVDQSGDAWVIMQLCGGASCSGPAQLYRIREGAWALVRESPDAFAQIKQMVLDGDGQGWLFWDGEVFHLEGDVAQPVASIDVLAVDVDPEGRLWVVADQAGGAGLWVAQPSPQFTPSPQPVPTSTKASFLPPDLEVISTRNAADLEPVAMLPERGASVVAFSPDSRRLAAGLFRSSQVQLWDLVSGAELLTLSGHADTRIISYLAFSPDGTRLASGAQAWDAPNDSLILWDLSTGRETQRFTGFLGAITPDWQSVALTQREQPHGATLTLSELASGEEIHSLQAPGDIYGISFSPDSSQVGAKMYNVFQDLFAFWSVDTGRLEHTLYDWAGFSYSPDGRYLAALAETGSGDKGELNLYAAANFKWIRTLAKDADTLWYTFPAFSPDGTIVAASFGDRVTLWDTQTGKALATLLASGPAGAAFSPDGRLLATFSQKGDVQLWGVVGEN